MRKKFFYCFIIVLTLIQLTMPIKVYSKNMNYLALGDSIAYGYGLEDIETQRYTQILKSELGIEDNNYKNLAISGITCKKFYNIIQKSVYTSAIKDSDLITISIGSNELLQVAVNAVASITGINANNSDFFEQIKDVFMQSSLSKRYEMATKIYEYFSSDEAKQQINENIKIYEEYWEKSIQFIKGINQNATIVVTEFYNPYSGIKIGEYELGSFTDEAIKQMNKILEIKSDNEKKYKIARIYEDFNKTIPKLTNANANVTITNFEINVDPHPNSNGHELIASKILDTISISSSNKEVNIEPIVVRKSQNTTINEQESKLLRIIIWATVGALMYFIIKRVNKNQKNRK